MFIVLLSLLFSLGAGFALAARTENKPHLARRALVASAAPLVLVGSAAMAQTTGIDYSGITGAVDWSSVSTGIITIFGDIVTVLVSYVGGKFLLKAIRGA